MYYHGYEINKSLRYILLAKKFKYSWKSIYQFGKILNNLDKINIPYFFLPSDGLILLNNMYVYSRRRLWSNDHKLQEI